jgi:hypothetical protein
MSEGLSTIEELVRAMDAVENAVTGYGDPSEEFRGLVLMRTVADRLAAVVKDVSTTLGEAGNVKADIDGVPYQLKQSSSYKWHMPDLFERLSAVATERGISEAEALRVACSITSAKSTGLKELGVDPDEFRTAQLGSWRLEGPKQR